MTLERKTPKKTEQNKNKQNRRNGQEPRAELEADPEQDRERTPSLYHAYRQVETRTIVLRTRLQEPDDEGRKKQKLGTGTDGAATTPTDLLIQDDAEYSEDATLFVEKDSLGRMCERVANYGISEETRGLKNTMGGGTSAFAQRGGLGGDYRRPSTQ